ncbi:hypothetical protein CSHISOI_11120 [Colletotrichum shisoi]|uniref:Uncharacterized protein n=1 Tax=Colletotrichum shisoi TaxID=2078593 RepID=A0A5Q4BBH4_9PEZI|nr:hypothetical protein CSHISOI_11120 [Colletotrichum shisoi]
MADDAPQEPASASASASAAPIPPLVTLTEPRWRWNGQLYDMSEIPKDFVFGAHPLERVVVPRDADNMVVLWALKRAHRRYKADISLSEDSYYAGIEGGLFIPVFIRPHAGSGADPNMDNSYSGVMLGNGATNKRSGLIVPPVDMLRPRQLTFLKTQSLGPEFLPDDAIPFRQVSRGERERHLRNQQDAFSTGQPCPVLVRDPAARPDYHVFQHLKVGNWEAFMMDMPKLDSIRVPRSLVDEVESFLAKYPRDMVPVNLAVSMAIAWAAYCDTTEYQPELASSKRRRPPVPPSPTGDLTRPVPHVDLAVLILYSPHYFRLHEEHGLCAYAHIFRVVSALYAKDRHFNEAFEIRPDDIDHAFVSACVRALNLRDEDWEEIVPPSFDGSRLVMPLNHGTREPPSPELTATLMMPDIYTLGFPGYTNEGRKGHGDVMRRVMMHRTWVPQHILDRNEEGTTEPLHQEYLGVESVMPFRDQDRHQLWSAPVTEVRSPFPVITGVVIDTPAFLSKKKKKNKKDNNTLQEMPVDDTPTPPDAGDEDETNAADQDRLVYSRNSVVDILTAYFRAYIADLRMAQDAGLISELVTLGADGYLAWPLRPERNVNAPRMPTEVDIAPLLVDDAARNDPLSDEDRLLLKKIVERDLTGDDKCFARCLEPLSRLDIDDPGLRRGRLRAVLVAAVRPVRETMDRVSSYRSPAHDDDDDAVSAAFTDELVKPCCELLGIGASGGNAGQSMKAIQGAERDLHALLTNVSLVVKYQRGNADFFRVAKGLIMGAACFRYLGSLGRLYDRLSRVPVEGADEKEKVMTWDSVFRPAVVGGDAGI